MEQYQNAIGVKFFQNLEEQRKEYTTKVKLEKGQMNIINEDRCSKENTYDGHKRIIIRVSDKTFRVTNTEKTRLIKYVVEGDKLTLIYSIITYDSYSGISKFTTKFVCSDLFGSEITPDGMEVQRVVKNGFEQFSKTELLNFGNKIDPIENKRKIERDYPDTAYCFGLPEHLAYKGN